MKARLLLLFVLFFALPVLAESRYVVDEFKITVRTGEGTQFGIISMLRSGDKVEVVSRNADSGWSRVRLASGKEGYALSQYLQRTPTAAKRLAVVEAELARLRSRSGQVEAELSTKSDTLQQTTAAREALESQVAGLEEELAALRETSASAVATARERDSLVERLTSLQGEMQRLKAHNEQLQSNEGRRWFMVGSGVLVLGLVIGLVVPSFRWRRRRDSWGSL
ncbi:MAG: TIGR04211 family SH3 domain-containing protein [Gammaproteobacteria bacterium]|nr:TIGR04211 family SH3 domain-containing protein [Gammaproteobacteria bacterium]